MKARDKDKTISRPHAYSLTNHDLEHQLIWTNALDNQGD